jgi:predicted O-methyltransferase YrrM
MKLYKKAKRLAGDLIKILDPVEREFNDVYPMIDTVEGFLKSPSQERWFFRSAKRANDNAVIVEIGSFKGRSSVSFGFGCVGSGKHVYSIDLFEGDGGDYGDTDFQMVFEQNVRRCALRHYITPIRSHSLSVAKTWDKPIDILFIDGSHEYQDVKADFEAFSPFVRKGGIIALHDIKGKWTGVIKFWSEIQAMNILKNIGQVSSLGFGHKM